VAKKVEDADSPKTGSRKVTVRNAASCAVETVASESASKAAKKAAASDLSQAAKKKR